MRKGKVFSIEEFSTFDGPGIRTTVFLKGCPLRCEWCHNPEGQSKKPEYVRSPNGCLKCGRCIEAGLEESGVEQLTGASVKACPRNLVRLCGTEYSSAELTGILLKNSDILTASGGGVTFSGGEPLYQAEFLTECLDLLEGKINRALQTSGFAQKDIFNEVLKRIDYVLFDIKIMDDEYSRAMTGQSNTLILENYKTLAESGLEFVTRVPLIPGVTDTEKNITQIACLLEELNVRFVELLPYNKMAGAKYAMTGRKYEPDFDESRENEIHGDIFESHGISFRIM